MSENNQPGLRPLSEEAIICAVDLVASDSDVSPSLIDKKSQHVLNAARRIQQTIDSLRSAPMELGKVVEEIVERLGMASAPSVQRQIILTSLTPLIAGLEQRVKEAEESAMVAVESSVATIRSQLDTEQSYRAQREEQLGVALERVKDLESIIHREGGKQHNDWKEGSDAMARHCSCAIQLIYKGSWSLVDADRWLNACLTNDAAYVKEAMSKIDSARKEGGE